MKFQITTEWKECNPEKNGLPCLPNLTEGLKSIGYYDVFGIWIGCLRKKEEKTRELIEAARKQAPLGFRLHEPTTKYDKFRWEKRFSIVSFQWKNETATVKSHQFREAVAEVSSVEIWDADGDLPCISMKGKLTTKNGEEYHLSGARDVGMRTGYSPRLSVYPIECA